MVEVETSICNDSEQHKKAKIQVNLKDATGKIVGTKSIKIKGIAEIYNVKLSIKIPSAQLWSPDNPYLYTAEIIVKDLGTDVEDTLLQRFGIRKLEFSATDGFCLNGKPTLLRGGCIHHDNGLLGAAAYDAAELRKLQLLKAQGYNAIRCSHNMSSENLLNLCDSLGLMVIDEAFDQWIKKKKYR